MSTPRITFGMIVLNAEPFILYNLRAIYPFAHQIVVVEGACPSSRKVVTADGHSLDQTLLTLRRFKDEEDHEKKLEIVTAEDEGRPDGFWSEKDEMSEAYARRATGNYLWQVDADEFYLPGDICTVIKMLENDPSISEVTFPMRTFWGGLSYLVDGFFLRQFVVHRLFAWGLGYRYTMHRPPTVIDEKGNNLRDVRGLSALEMARQGIFMYHYELLFPKQVREKCAYYTDAQWTDMFQELDKWMEESYFSLARTFRVHMLYQHLSWLERFTGLHHPQVVHMVQDIRNGKYHGIEMRWTEDIESLLSSPSYIIRRAMLKSIVPLNNLRIKVMRNARSILKESPLWLLFQKVRGDLVPIKPEAVSDALINAWKNHSIPGAQGALVAHELSEMYAGCLIRPYQALAEAVRATGCEFGEMIEVGCATGYYSEVLRYLLGHEINYKGIDYSEAMIVEARRKYPNISFQVGDAMALPFANGACDILISGCVLLHMPDYRQAIAESARVSRRWVIFHRTPMTTRKTRYFIKKAYGVPCVEIHFGEQEFMEICTHHGLKLVKEFEITRGESEYVMTYLFEKIRLIDELDS